MPPRVPALLLLAAAAVSDAEWLPPDRDWTLQWADEFTGTGQPSKWFPMLGYAPEDFQKNTEKGLRWSGSTEDTAYMYSTKTGNHWLDGEGHLIVRVVSNKTALNVHGPKVESAYLLSGYPASWDSSSPSGVKWAGEFVTPENGPIYISARMRTDQVLGYSTWFGFWMFSETRAYLNDPANGTEIDLVEIPKGAPAYLDTAFNVAQHWNQSGGDESKQFNSGSTPPSTSLVNVSDTDYHVFGLEWTTSQLRCFVDGQLYYTFNDNIPSHPVDMMMMLTLEYQPNIWDAHAGDGRTEGPFVSDDAEMREMSRALIDYVHVHISK